MKHLRRFLPLIFIFVFLFSVSASAQQIGFYYRYQLDLGEATDPPKFLGDLLDIDYPASARKNGVVGTVKASATLGPDGKVVNISVSEGLPHGVSEAVKAGLEKMKFEPAKSDDKPIPVKIYIEYTISAVYGEEDKEVQKPKITQKPIPAYPEKYRAEKLKDKVYVTIQFNADGTSKVVGVSSTMPKEFDKAALEAAKTIKFEPAVHKKSKQAVTQTVVVPFEFKP